MTLTFDLLTSKWKGFILDSWGVSISRFHDHRLITESVIVRKPFTINQAPWPWPLTFWPQNQWVHPRLIGSKCMKFHDHRLITESVIVWKPFTINHAPWPWSLTFWPQNQLDRGCPNGTNTARGDNFSRRILDSWGVCMWSFMMIGVKRKWLCAGNHFQ